MGKVLKLWSLIRHRYLLDLYQKGENCIPWLKFINNILIETGLPFIWQSQTPPEWPVLKYSVDQTRRDLFALDWKNNLQRKSSCSLYTKIKNKLELESYLTWTIKGVQRAASSWRTLGVRSRRTFCSDLAWDSGMLSHSHSAVLSAVLRL